MTTAIPAEGRVELRLEWDGRVVQRAEVRSRRPQPAALLTGRAPGQARAIIPRLYSLCGDAQSVAVEALEAVLRSGAPDSNAIADWAERIRLENIREHLWRLGLDWPRVVGEPQQPAPVRELLGERTRFATDREAAGNWAGKTFADLFGHANLAWLENPEPDSLAQWLEEAPTPLAGLLARLRPRLTGLGPSALPFFRGRDLQPMVQTALPRLQSDPDFHWRPDHQGQVFEMGPLPRQAAHPLIAAMLACQGVPDSWLRVLARVLELAGALDSLQRGIEPRLGIAWQRGAHESMVALEMVRGVLMHWQEAVPDGIRDYRIVAPTEWNFHPEGPAREGLLQLQAPDEPQLREMVTLQVMALDPCVQYELEILHA
ncbi:nickel-dependent hydrogenase large subunit [Thioalkalivibrio sp.]|uniref:nickel-dependent hydrogenase large subunit n=1 Tax=Thioalkalivibrio sp. TaxID=2093813 RepID=UPI0035649863